MIHAREPISPLKRLRSVYYGWWMVGVTAVIMAIAGLVFQSMSVWNPALRGVFSWTPGQMSWALAFMRIEGGLLGPVEGFLVERLGSRRMVLIGMLVLGCGFLLFSKIGELWRFYAVFFFMALGSGLGSRRMVFIGMLVLGCGFLLFSKIGELWRFYAVFFLMALGSGLGSWLPLFAALNN